MARGNRFVQEIDEDKLQLVIVEIIMFITRICIFLLSQHRVGITLKNLFEPEVRYYMHV